MDAQQTNGHSNHHRGCLLARIAQPGNVPDRLAHAGKGRRIKTVDVVVAHHPLKLGDRVTMDPLRSSNGGRNAGAGRILDDRRSGRNRGVITAVEENEPLTNAKLAPLEAERAATVHSTPACVHVRSRSTKWWASRVRRAGHTRRRHGRAACTIVGWVCWSANHPLVWRWLNSFHSKHCPREPESHLHQNACLTLYLTQLCVLRSFYLEL